MRSARLALRTLLPVALLAACSDSGQPTAPDAPTLEPASGPDFFARPNPSFQPFAFTVDNCVEPVAITGTFHETLQFFIGPGGKLHFRFHTNAKGVGIGEVTGTRYQWNDRLFDITNVAPRGTESFTLNDRTRLIGQGGAPNATFAVQVKVTINANGTFTVERVRFLEVCG